MASLCFPAFSQGIEALDIDAFIDRAGRISQIDLGGITLEQTTSSGCSYKAWGRFNRPTFGQSTPHRRRQSSVRQFHQALLGLPFSAVIDTTLNDLRRLWRLPVSRFAVSQDEDIVTRPNELLARKQSLSSGEISGPRSAFSTNIASGWRQIRAYGTWFPASSEGAVVFPGFDYRPGFRIVSRVFGPLRVRPSLPPESIILCGSSSAAHWVFMVLTPRHGLMLNEK